MTEAPTRLNRFAFPLHRLLLHEGTDEELAEHVHGLRKMLLLDLEVERCHLAIRRRVVGTTFFLNITV